jgi:hypothetical protein
VDVVILARVLGLALGQAEFLFVTARLAPKVDLLSFGYGLDVANLKVLSTGETFHTSESIKHGSVPFSLSHVGGVPTTQANAES